MRNSQLHAIEAGTQIELARRVYRTAFLGAGLIPGPFDLRGGCLLHARCRDSLSLLILSNDLSEALTSLLWALLVLIMSLVTIM